MAELSVWDKLAAMMSGGAVGQNQVPQTPMGSTPIELAMLNAPPRPPVPEPFALPETGIPQAPPQVVTQQAAPLSKVPPAPAVEPGMARSRIGYNIPGPSANTQALLDQLEGKGLESLKAQGLTVEALKKQLEAAGRKETPWNLQPLAALVDTWTGSRLAPSMEPQVTAQTIAAEKERLQNALLKAQQGMSDDELAMLKNKLSTQLGIEQMAAGEREKAASNATQLEAARIAAGAKAAKGAEGHILPQVVVDRYTKAQGTVDLASSLRGLIQNNASIMGPAEGGVMNALGLSKFSAPRAKLNSDFATVKQEIAHLMEGGVLRKEDEAKYDKLLPNAGDLPEVALHKADQMEKRLRTDVSRYIENYGKAGYNIGNFKEDAKRYSENTSTAKNDDMVAAAAAELARRGVK